MNHGKHVGVKSHVINKYGQTCIGVDSDKDLYSGYGLPRLRDSHSLLQNISSSCLVRMQEEACGGDGERKRAMSSWACLSKKSLQDLAHCADVYENKSQEHTLISVNVSILTSLTFENLASISFRLLHNVPRTLEFFQGNCHSYDRLLSTEGR